MTAEEIGGQIIAIAAYFEGLHEVKQNAEWDNLATPSKDPAAEELRQALKRAGWMTGWPYCMSFCEAVWRQAYQSLEAPIEIQQRIAARLNPSVLGSFNNWKVEINQKPLPGSIFFMQLAHTGHGHAGIVVKASDYQFASIEANTSPMAASPEADREGDGVFRKVRRLDFQERPGLWLRGFLNPISW